MKKIFYAGFSVIAVLFIISLVWRIVENNKNISIFLIEEKMVIGKVMNNEERRMSLLSYIDLLKYKFMSEDIFIELPEDSVELEPQDIEDEGVIEEIPTEKNINTKSVTLDWSKVLKNETKYKIDVNKLKNSKLSFDLTKKGKEFIIYHTHGTEAYSKSEGEEYEENGYFRTLNKAYNVVSVGRRLKDLLEKKGYGVYHDEEMYDYPSYNLSYSKAGKSIVSLAKKQSEAKVILDVHRDALGTNTEVYKPIINVDGKAAAQILLVVGTNQGGLYHPNWRENLKFALKIQEIANKKYPGLCRYVILRKERFNQQVTSGAIIVEMGATGNTSAEVLFSAELLSEVLCEVLS